MSDPMPLTADPAFAELKRYVIQTTGLTYYQDKDEDLGQRLGRRLEALGLDTCRGYLDRLTSGPEGTREFELLAAELTIGETYFFRHEEQFDDLRTTIVPELIRRNQGLRRLHVWCAGCSIGAEPYSLAILLDEHFGAELAGWDVRIVATDLNRDFLARAKAGVFDEWAFRTTKPEFRARHFTRDGKAWAIKPAYRRHVEFRYHNLVTHPWTCAALTGEFDLIVCRNVMIYFDALTNAKVAAFFAYALSERGWLVVGHAEMIQDASQLEQRQLPRVTAYRKRASVVATDPPPVETPVPEPVAVIPPPTPPRQDRTPYLKMLANRGELDLALHCANELIDQDAAHAVAYYYRALVVAQLGRDAGPDLRRATEVDPKFVMAHYQAALHFERRGDRIAAAHHRRLAMNLLDQLPDEQPLPEGDDLRVRDLRDLIAGRRQVA